MKNSIYYIIITLLFNSFSIHSYSQMTRGALPEELYISAPWYHEYVTTYYALFRSVDNGEHIALQCSDTQSFGWPLGDASTGILYDYNTLGEFKVSYDYGKNWEFIESFGTAAYITGCVNGEIYKATNYKLYRSTNYGDTFEIIADTSRAPLDDVGTLPGELYGLNGYHIQYSNDYGQSFAYYDIDTSFNYPDLISRGALPGELYLITWDYGPAYYRIYHSLDYGATFELKYTSPNYDLFYWAFDFTAGREPGSFYASRARIDEITHEHVHLYIDYSNDYGKTFTTYFHDLLPDVSIEDKIVEVNQLFNLPNPFTSQTSVNFTLPKETEVNINVTSLQGVMVKKIRLGKCTAGYHSYSLDGSDLPQGMYLCTLFANGEKVQTVKMIKAE